MISVQMNICESQHLLCQYSRMTTRKPGGVSITGREKTALVLPTLDSTVWCSRGIGSTASKIFSVVSFETGEMLRFLQFLVIIDNADGIRRSQ